MSAAVRAFDEPARTVPPRAPEVSISLVTWQGMRWLPGCLDSVAAQTLGSYEVLLFDNASDDGSAAWLSERAAEEPRLKLVTSPRNVGYARGHNRNIERARGKSVLLLNQDVVLDEHFLERTSAVLRERPSVGSVQGLVRRLGADGGRLTLIDTTGLLMRRDRRARIRDHRRDDGDASVAATRPGYVWGVDGPVGLFRAEALRDASLPRRGGGTEVLDEDFYMQKEDVDLAWRLRRLGWCAWYEPAALAWHARTGIGSAAPGIPDVARANMANELEERSRSWRNQRLMQVKNDELSAFVRHLPWIAWRELLELAFITLFDPRRLGALPDLLQALPWAMRKRRALTARVDRKQGLPRRS